MFFQTPEYKHCPVLVLHGKNVRTNLLQRQESSGVEMDNTHHDFGGLLQHGRIHK